MRKLKGACVIWATSNSLDQSIPMRQDISFRQAAWVVLGLAVVQFALQMSLLTRGVAYVTASLTIDDTYYYLQSAWNTKHLGFVTFDGLHPTNGVQFLWFVIILALAMLANTKTALMFAALSVSFLLNALCYAFILKIGDVLQRPALALLMAGLWFLQSLPFRIYSMGMENSLHAWVFWGVIWQSLLFLVRVQDRARPNIWGLTVALILNAWTRFDSALLSAIVYVFCLGTLAHAYWPNWRLFLQSHKIAIAGSSLLAASALIAQLTAFWLMGESFLPVSALVKTSGAGRGLGAESAVKFVEVLILGMPSILQGRLPTVALALLGVLGIALVIRAQVTTRGHPVGLRAFLKLWFCLLAGELLYHLAIAVSGAEYTAYFIWYRSPSFIFWILTASLAAYFTLERLRLEMRPVKILNWVPVGFSLLSFAVALYLFARSLDFTSKLYVARYDAALWIAENFPPDTIFAAWNTGQLGYFSDRTFINLDGVINSVDYYERVLRGPVPLADYLAENKVDYIVDYSIYHPVPDYPVVHTFPLNDETGRSIQIWQVSPQLSSAP